MEKYIKFHLFLFLMQFENNSPKKYGNVNVIKPYLKVLK